MNVLVSNPTPPGPMAAEMVKDVDTIYPTDTPTSTCSGRTEPVTPVKDTSGLSMPDLQDSRPVKPLKKGLSVTRRLNNKKKSNPRRSESPSSTASVSSKASNGSLLKRLRRRRKKKSSSGSVSEMSDLTESSKSRTSVSRYLPSRFRRSKEQLATAQEDMEEAWLSGRKQENKKVSKSKMSPSDGDKDSSEEEIEEKPEEKAVKTTQTEKPLSKRTTKKIVSDAISVPESTTSGKSKKSSSSRLKKLFRKRSKAKKVAQLPTTEAKPVVVLDEAKIVEMEGNRDGELGSCGSSQVTTQTSNTLENKEKNEDATTSPSKPVSKNVKGDGSEDVTENQTTASAKAVSAVDELGKDSADATENVIPPIEVVSKDDRREDSEDVTENKIAMPSDDTVESKPRTLQVPEYNDVSTVTHQQEGLDTEAPTIPQDQGRVNTVAIVFYAAFAAMSATMS